MTKQRLDNDEVLLGIDIGGTAVKFGALSEAGDVLLKSSFATTDLADEASLRTFARELTRALHPRISPDNVRAVGCAVPGAVDDCGRIGLIPNANIDAAGLLDALGDAFPRTAPVALNDANAATLGEQRLGTGAGAESVLLVTLGTGIGAGVAHRGGMLFGAHGCAGEIGHLCIERAGRSCSCGGSGCLEQYASARGIVATMREESGGAFQPAHDTDARAVFEAFTINDPAARRTVERFCDALAFGLATAACAIDPQVILVGGGVSDSFDLFARSLREHFVRYAIPPCKTTPIMKAQLGNDAGFIGAAMFADACASRPDAPTKRKDVLP